MTETQTLPRRTMLAAGLATIATAALADTAAGAAPAPALSGPEALNSRIAAEFCAAWNDPKLDIDRLFARYFHDDCILRVMDSSTEARGKRATTAMLKGWMEGQRHFDLKVLASVALGPVVVQTRHDLTFSPGYPVHTDAIAGVFVFADGKIKEWSDYFM